jgi:hypothetical protein
MTENDLRWLPDLFETGYCVTLARSVASAELLTRMGADAESATKMTLEQAAHFQADLPWGKSVARVGVYQGWGYAVEDTGRHGANESTLSHISMGTQALALLRTADVTNRFTYAEDGRIICSFDPSTPRTRRGSDPDRLLAWMERLGLMSESTGSTVGPDEAMLTLAQDAFGAIVPRTPVESGRLLSAVVGE